MYGICANVLSDHVLRTGAKVYLLYDHGDAEHPYVIGRSKSGRMIKKYTHFKRLTRYRAAWIPPHIHAHMSHRHEGFQDDDRAIVARTARILGRMWQGIRSFHRDGTTIRHEGAPSSEAWRRGRVLETVEDLGDTHA